MAAPNLDLVALVGNVNYLGLNNLVEAIISYMRQKANGGDLSWALKMLTSGARSNLPDLIKESAGLVCRFYDGDMDKEIQILNLDINAFLQLISRYF